MGALIARGLPVPPGLERDSDEESEPQRPGPGGITGRTVSVPERKPYYHAPCPEGCMLYREEKPGQKPKWIAFLPRGVKHKGRNGRSRTYHPSLRTELAAKQQCEDWLWEAYFLGKLEGRQLVQERR